MREAVKRIADYALDDLSARRIEVHCDVKNIRSSIIPENLGSTLEGILKQDSVSICGDGLRDTCNMQK